MSASNVSRGARAKGRTKRWLTEHGYQVADLEIVRWIFAGGRRVPVKRDQFGADLLAVSSKEVLFVQVKQGKSARTGTFPDARREFDRFRFPSGTRQVVVAWAPRARGPRLVWVTHGPK